MDASWLCASGADRQRLLDMAEPLRAARRATFVALTLTLLASAPWIGLQPLLPFALAAAVFQLTERHLERRRRPEYWLFAGWAFCQLMVASEIVLTGGAMSIFVMWLCVPTITLGARFTRKGMRAGIALTAFLIVAATVGADPSVAWESPERIFAPLGALVGIAALASPLMISDVEHRAHAAVDGLTGLLNRAALERRCADIFGQAHVMDAWVGVVLGDLDHFKAVNDRHGHERGDDVLRDTAVALRGAMRSFDGLYRLGGEEFLVLLPGADVDEARRVGERLRTAVGEARPGGLDVSMSVGVSAARGPADFQALYRAADEALYRAKDCGRDRVEAAAA
jgi:diguanylate cyclase (GGDEF)-like protein